MCDEIQCEELNSVVDLYAARSFQLKYLSAVTVCYAWPCPQDLYFSDSVFWGEGEEGGLCLGIPPAPSLLNTSVTRSVNTL